MAPGALEILHQEELTRVMRQLLDVKRELYECQGQLAAAKTELLKYQTANTLRPGPPTEPYPDD